MQRKAELWSGKLCRRHLGQMVHSHIISDAQGDISWLQRQCDGSCLCCQLFCVTRMEPSALCVETSTLPPSHISSLWVYRLCSWLFWFLTQGLPIWLRIDLAFWPLGFHGPDAKIIGTYCHVWYPTKNFLGKYIKTYVGPWGDVAQNKSKKRPTKLKNNILQNFGTLKEKGRRNCLD